jgi:hypothetical protein
MEPEQLKPNLWRWSAPHPDWRANAEPGSSSDWPREVGCTLYEDPETAVYIDPLVPAGEESAFWAWADEHSKDKSVHVLTTISFHRRSRDTFLERYGAATSRAKRSLPSGVECAPLPGAGETLFWLPAPRTLIAGDRLIRSPEGELSMCPQSWLRYLDSGIRLAGLRKLLIPLLELPIETVLVSHGEPILEEGHAALSRALA